jgi:putative membrane protein
MMPPRKIAVSVAVIILFHVVGLVGFFVPALTPLFLKLVPFHLLLMLLVILVNHYRLSDRFWAFALLIFCLGILAEWIGVHKNWLFGRYQYGRTLGVKVADIPLMIGVNWLMLVYAAGVLMQRFRLKSMLFRILIGAALLVLLDILIEPVAIKFDYWTWINHSIPLKNYLCWFGVSAAFLWIFESFKFKTQSIVAPILLLVQFIFFLLLQIKV